MRKYVVGGVEMPLPIILGAGVCKSPVSLVPYQRDDVSFGALVTGSYTPDEPAGQEDRKGNDDGKNICQWPAQIESGTRFDFGSNSWGMPNMGCTKAKYLLSEMLLPKKTIVSIAAFSVAGYMAAADTFGRNAPWVAAQEWNFGCPNAHDKKVLPISYDYDSCEMVLEAGNQLQLDCPTWFKMSPYLTSEDVALIASFGIDVSHMPVFDDDTLEQFASLIARYPYVRAVVASNTGPNAIYRVNGQPVTTPNGGKAGLSGPVMLEIALRQVKRFRAALPSSIDVIHSGGIWYGGDVVKAMENGAAAVQITSLPVWSGGPRAPGQLIEGSEKLQNFLSQSM